MSNPPLPSTPNGEDWWRRLIADAYRMFYTREDRQLTEPDAENISRFAQGQISGSGQVLMFLADAIRERRNAPPTGTPNGEGENDG